MGEIDMFRLQHVHEFEIGSICHLIDDTLERLCHSAHCDHYDWFQG